MTPRRRRQPDGPGGAARPTRVRRAWDTVRYGVRLTLLTFFGPARLDDAHDPIARLKRERARQLAGYASPSGDGRVRPAATSPDVDDAEHAERLRFE